MDIPLTGQKCILMENYVKFRNNSVLFIINLKAYKLYVKEQEALNDILNFLILIGLVKMVDSNSMFTKRSIYI